MPRMFGPVCALIVDLHERLSADLGFTEVFDTATSIHTFLRPNAVFDYRYTSNCRPVGVEREDALSIAEQVEI